MITYPRTMPALGLGREHFEPQRVDFLSPEAGGRLSAVSAGFPLWKARWQFADGIGRVRSDEWRAWVASLRGAQKLFHGFEQGRAMPLLYPNGFGGLTRFGGGAFDGTALTWSVNGTRDVLTVTGLPVGLSLSLGDYWGFNWTTSSQARRALVRHVEAVVADASGVAAFSIEPPLPTLVPGGAVATLDHPTCLMKLIPSETEIGDKGRRGAVSGRIGAIQELLA